MSSAQTATGAIAPDSHCLSDHVASGPNVEDRSAVRIVTRAASIIDSKSGVSFSPGLNFEDGFAAEKVRFLHFCGHQAANLRIPAKANTDSGGNANGIPGRRRTVLGA
jgi:hypothetical protein